MKNNALRLLVMLVWVACSQATTAQSGRLVVRNQSTDLDTLFAVNLRTNNNQTTLDGYRIQIYSGSGVAAKKEAQDAQNRFLASFPNERVYMTYTAPTWRVRIGDYRYRSEALDLLTRIKRQFQGSYIVRDNTVRKRAFY